MVDDKTPREADKTSWETASEWFARTLAIVVVMVTPGAIGAWLDKRLGTPFLTLGGFLIGMVTAIGMLLLYTRIKPTEPRSRTAGLATGHLPKLEGGSRDTTTNISQKGTALPKPSSEMLPSETALPTLPGAEILEPPKHGP